MAICNDGYAADGLEISYLEGTIGLRLKQLRDSRDEALGEADFRWQFKSNDVAMKMKLI
jgi:hypothetical protein